MRKSHLCCGFVICAVLAWSGAAFAASPSLGGPSPRGGQRGTEQEVTISGGNLIDAAEVLFHEPGIEVTKFEVVDNGNVKATFKIAPDAENGQHRFRIRTKTGITDLRTFFVGPLPSVDEKEPNSDFQTPQPVPMNSTVVGVIDSEDVDYFVVEAKKGDRITAEVEAWRLGISMFDVYVAILNSARFELSTSDDSALVYQDGIASVVAPEDGKYIVQIRDSSYGGNGSCLYRTHIGTFPRPMGTVPAGGKPGETLKMKFVGDVAGTFEQDVTLPGTPSERATVFAQDANGMAPSANYIRINDLNNTVEAEPNDTNENATRFAAPGALNGVLEKPGDEDRFRFPAKKGEVYDIRVYARSLRSSLDPVVEVHYATAGGITGNDDNVGPDSYIRFGVPEDQEYTIRITDHLKNGGPGYFYRVEVTPVKPKLTLAPAEFVQFNAPVVAIPRGNRYPLMINASRADFGGPLKLRGEGLPAGVTIETPGVHPGLGNAPVIFQAAADAPLAGAMVDIIGTLDDPNQPNPVEGRLSQDVALVRGQNQIPVWVETVPRLAMAVIDESPYSIEIVEPKVPIVLDGSMQLKVVAKRKEGFTAPIKIDMLWNPPGINSSREVSIPEGQNEALISMNAAGNSSVGEWKIAVMGQATIRLPNDIGNGTLMVSSQLATLRIADRYLNFTFEAAAVEQGKETEMVVKVAKNVDFPGDAAVTLLGLPHKVTAPVMTVNKDAAELIFKVKTEAESPAGSHKNLFCQVVVTENNEPVVHNLGGGQLRIDVPLPPKANEPPPPAPMPVAEAKPTEAPPAPPKRLTRLEQLRLEQQQREAAKAAGK